MTTLFVTMLGGWACWTICEELDARASERAFVRGVIFASDLPHVDEDSSAPNFAKLRLFNVGFLAVLGGFAGVIFPSSRFAVCWTIAVLLFCSCRHLVSLQKMRLAIRSDGQSLRLSPTPIEKFFLL